MKINFFKKRVSVEEKDGFFCWLSPSGQKIYTHDIECIKRVYRHIFDRHIYDFESHSESPLIIDAGANIGLGVIYWKRKYPKARIIAFEPSRKAFLSLKKNVEENNLSDVQCINKALSNFSGVQRFTTNEVISGSLVMDKNLEINYEVKTTKLGKFLNEKVDLLKIDIEGAEKFIYNDIEENIQNLNLIFLEYHSFNNEKQYLSKYLKLFERNNFRYFIEDEFKKSSHFLNRTNSLNQDMQLNIWIQKSDS